MVKWTMLNQLVYYLMVVVLRQVVEGILQSNDVPGHVLRFDGEDEQRPDGDLAGDAQAVSALRRRHVVAHCGHWGLTLDKHDCQLRAAPCQSRPEQRQSFIFHALYSLDEKYIQT